jgi:hypothetical protein
VSEAGLRHLSVVAGEEGQGRMNTRKVSAMLALVFALVSYFVPAFPHLEVAVVLLAVLHLV